MIREAIATVVDGRDLSEEEAAQVMTEIMEDGTTPAQIGALLTALRLKGESVSEIAGMVRIMRQKALRVAVAGDVLDIVSTGGGSFDPFNISTTAALVCAGAGIRVAKHGNRGFTSTSGAADVLEALGAKLELTPEQSVACIEKSGFAFLFAPAFHPAMRFVGPARREIGIRTIFNSLGPLTNPAGAQHQLLGVGDGRLVPKIAEVLSRLGTGHALVVRSEDGLDEISLSAPTRIEEVRGHEVSSYTLNPEEAGFARLPLAAVKTGTPAENAVRLRAVLSGERGPDRDYVLINAAAGIFAADRAATIQAGLSIAVESIDTGAARRVLDAFVETTRSFSN